MNGQAWLRRGRDGRMDAKRKKDGISGGLIIDTARNPVGVNRSIIRS